MRKISAIIFLLFFHLCVRAQNISTVAGIGVAADSGDDGPATSAKIFYPGGVVFDPFGNYYFVEASHNIVRKVSVCGTINTVAGNGSAGYSGDDVAATATELNFPTELAFDTIGNMYINDLHNNRIRKVDVVTGIISTYAGNGVGGYGSDGVAATSTSINGPAGIACDSFGNLYI